MKKAMALAAMLLTSASAWAGIVTWQLDMSVQIGLGNFTPGVDQVVVRGFFNGWGGTNPTLTDPDNDMIYTGSYDHTGVPAPYEYKYVILFGGNPDAAQWEFVDNRPYDYMGEDLLLPVQFFNNVETLPGVCDVEITFQVDMNVQIATGAFDPMTQGVFYRGPYNGWSGYDQQLMDAGGGIYAIELPFDAQDEASCIEHKFIIATDDGMGGFGGDNWESSPNRCAYGDCSWVDTDSDGYLEGVLAPVFFGDINWDAIVDRDVLVTFNIDANPIACWFANGYPEQGGLSSYGDVSFISVHGFFNGWPAWDGNIDPLYRAMPVGGNIWSVSVLFPMGSSKVQIYKYGANGWDNEAGFGQDHSLNLDDDGGSGVLVVNDVFGSPGNLWDCEWTVSADERPAGFALAPAYPNPFNPTTTIRFSLEESALATLAVFDLTGAKVATLVDGLTSRGEHSVVFDASQIGRAHV